MLNILIYIFIIFYLPFITIIYNYYEYNRGIETGAFKGTFHDLSK